MSEIIKTTKAELSELIQKKVGAAVENERKKFELTKNEAPVISDVKSRDTGLVTIRTMRTVYAAKQRGVNPRDYAEELASKTNSDVDYRVVKGLQASDFVGGGALVPESMTSDVIPYLNDASVFYSKIRQVPMPTGSLTIPKITNTATKYWGAENARTRASKQGFGTINLNSKELSVIVPISKNLIMGAVPAGINVEQIILADLQRAFIPDVEAQILRGSGTNNELLGVYNRVPSSNKFNSAGTTFANVVADAKKAIGRIVSSNVQLVNGQWVMSARSANHVRFIPGTTSDDMKFMLEVREGKWLGYDFGVSNYIPNTINTSQSEVYLFDLDSMVIGVQKGLSIETSDMAAYYDENGSVQSAFAEGMVLIKMQMSLDFGMYYDTAAAVIEQVTWE